MQIEEGAFYLRWVLLMLELCLDKESNEQQKLDSASDSQNTALLKKMLSNNWGKVRSMISKCDLFINTIGPQCYLSDRE